MRFDTPAVAKNAPSTSNAMDETIAWLAQRAAEACRLTVKEELDELVKNEAPEWQNASRRDAAYEAASVFDVRQGALRHSTHEAWQLTVRYPYDMPPADEFRQTIGEFFRHRYAAADDAKPPQTMHRIPYGICKGGSWNGCGNCL